jgi:ribose 5-phosphate isomerase B
MQLYIGADHNGFELKKLLSEKLAQSGYEVIDKGDTELRPDDDFPQFAEQAVQALLGSDDPTAKAVLICGSGQGMCMAANRFRGIRASVIWDADEARAARNDDDSNVLCLPARSVSAEEAISITETWLATPFAGAARFKRRIKELDELSS